MDATGEPSYAQEAQENYERGQRARESGRYLDAIKYFEHVRFKFPYTRFAALSDLALADTHFDREKYIEAVEGYRAFLKMHPNHEMADYAHFQIARSHFEDIPSDFFLFPPSTEKDQRAVREAEAALTEHLQERPDSKYAPEARKLHEEVRRRLAEHEIRVAEFYLHRDRCVAAAGRFQRVLDAFPGLGHEGRALWEIGRCYFKLGDTQKAREALERLVREHPSHPRRVEAEALLAKLS
jgi:outer membrane protein assembly factor BamD